MPLDLDRVDQIVDALSAMMRRRAIARKLETLRELTAEPETVDEIILAAINASLRLGDDRAATPGQRLPLNG